MNTLYPLSTRNSPCRVGLIGVTGYGKIHLNHLLWAADKGLATVSTAVVINPDHAEEACGQLQSRGTRIYPDYESMLREEQGRLDLCLIPTGINWHAPMTIAALRSGAHVLVEKPLCGTDAEARAMMEAEAGSERFIAVGFQDIYDPKVLAAKQLLLDGKIGRLKRIRGWALWPRGQSYYSRNSWAGKIMAGNQPVFDSPFNNAMAHFLNLLLFFGGTTMEEMAEIDGLEAELFRTRSIESFDTGSLLAGTTSGVELVFHGSHSCRENIHPQIWMEGEQGTLLWSFDGSIRLIYAGQATPLFEAEPGEKKLQRMMESVLSRVSDPSQWICTAGMASTHTRLINRLHREFPIRDLPPSCFQIHAEDPEQIPVIHHIEEHVSRASEEGCFLGKLLPL